MAKKKLVNIVTLGCSKNLVDSEKLISQLEENNIEIVHNSDSFKAQTVVINTCGFIQDAKEESINTILNFIEAKKAGKIEKVIVMGCLSERYKDELKAEIPEADAYFGVYETEKIVEYMGGGYVAQLDGVQKLTTPAHFAYLKVSEGCDRTCSFCAIPVFKGKHKSVPTEILLRNARNMAAKGVRELILIAQDLTAYGVDIYGESRLGQLITKLSEIDQLHWIRLHYAYPAGFPQEIIPIIASNPKICKYIDMPMQHISDNMLRKMRRGHTKKMAMSLLNRLRNEIPGVALRTTILVGHPGETEQDFEELKDFVREFKFDRLGVFTYSDEEQTYAHAKYEDAIPQEVKQARAEEIMAIQQEISEGLNKAKIGTQVEVLVDRKEGGYYIGRTQYDSPEVDNEVLIPADRLLKIGAFYNATILRNEEFDLYATLD